MFERHIHIMITIIFILLYIIMQEDQEEIRKQHYTMRNM